MAPVLIKRYRNRRLYDTGRSRYITYEDLAQDLMEGRSIRIADAKTGEDLTKRTLMQVLLTEEHVHKLECIPEEFLRTLIQIEDKSLMRLFHHYLHMTLKSFAVAQQAMHQNLELFKSMAPGGGDLMGVLGRLIGRPPSKEP
ncbi:hypothetical protein KKF91_20020 [Myxococcota bacterium]|nr:hypothetical protein [Myxococcota bacterium]MBU1432833.1 hypothetical protein [Myxococcota bacterium]MBU1897541.1 hypothetical protein [Myxococcota bacterium]